MISAETQKTELEHYSETASKADLNIEGQLPQSKYCSFSQTQVIVRLLSCRVSRAGALL